MAFSEGRTGHFQRSDGAPGEIRLGRFAELHTEQIVGKYYELARRGYIYTAANQSAVNFGIALTATAVTFTLYNPQGSGVNLSLLQCGIAYSALQTTTTTVEDLVYAANTDPSAAAPSTVTKLTVHSAALSNSVGQGLAYSVATLPAVPQIVRIFPMATQNTVTTQLAQPNLAAIDYVDGAIVLPPNTAVTIQGLATTTTASGFVSMVWAEIPA